MYSPSAIQASFSKLVGFLQANDPNVPQISGNLLLSDSGVFMQNIHPLATLDNLYYACPDFTPTKWPGWVTGTNYVAGKIINAATSATNSTLTLYKALNAMTPSTVVPYTDTTNWAPYNPYLLWLTQLFNQASSNCIGEVVKRKKLFKMGKALLEKQQLYRGYGQQNNTIVKLGRAVGFEIKPAAVDGLLMQIDAIGMQVTSSQSELNWYLYHSSQDEPLGVFHIPLTAQNFAWQAVTNCILGFKQNGSDTSGVFMLVYYEDDLVGQAVSKTWDFGSAPCIGCDQVNAAMYNKWSRYTTIRTIEVAAQYLDEDRNLFNTAGVAYGNNSNYGANLSITVRCDLTNIIVENRIFWADAFAYQLAYEALKAIAYSPRVNPFNAKIQQMAMADLDPKVSGAFICLYNDSIDTLNIDLTGFSKSCTPEDESNTMSWGSI